MIGGGNSNRQEGLLPTACASHIDMLVRFCKLKKASDVLIKERKNKQR